MLKKKIFKVYIFLSYWNLIAYIVFNWVLFNKKNYKWIEVLEIWEKWHFMWFWTFFENFKLDSGSQKFF